LRLDFNFQLRLKIRRNTLKYAVVRWNGGGTS
jgi:hypothetical protein